MDRFYLLLQLSYVFARMFTPFIDKAPLVLIANSWAMIISVTLSVLFYCLINVFSIYKLLQSHESLHGKLVTKKLNMKGSCFPFLPCWCWPALVYPFPFLVQGGYNWTCCWYWRRVFCSSNPEWDRFFPPLMNQIWISPTFTPYAWFTFRLSQKKLHQCDIKALDW